MPTWRRSDTTSTPGPYASCPSMSTLPSTRAPGMMSFMRLSVRRNVLLPQPDGPMKAVTRLAWIFSEMASSARFCP